MTNLQSVPAKFAKGKYCSKQGHYIRMCLKRNHQRVHQIATSPGYDGQDIYLGEVIHSVTNYAKRIYAVVALNDQFKMKLKVDTGADICAVNTDDLQLSISCGY